MDLAELLIQRLDSDLAAAIRRWATSDDPSGCCFHYPGIPAAAVVPAIENIKVRRVVLLCSIRDVGGYNFSSRNVTVGPCG
jgi:hypothetical protein